MAPFIGIGNRVGKSSGQSWNWRTLISAIMTEDSRFVIISENEEYYLQLEN